MEWLSRRRLPVIAVDQQLGDQVPTVLVDDRGGAALGARHLLDLGHREIGVLALGRAEGPFEPFEGSDSFPSQQRLRGWRETLTEAGVEPTVVFASYQPHDSALDAARRLLETTEVTAVLCFSDVFAHAVATTAEALGRRVPDDISIVGYDDSPLSRTSRPSLTTVRQDITAKGHLAAGALVDVLDGHPARSHLLPAELVVRDSTAPPGGLG